MGMFTKDDAPHAPLTPLARDRIVATLEASKWSYFIDSEGDVGGFWDYNVFYFFQFGQSKEIFQVRGLWRQRPPAVELPRLMGLVNEWNARHRWPKGMAYEASGMVQVRGELSVDYEHGVTDAQLSQHVRCAISTTMDMFSHLETYYAFTPVEPPAQPDAQ